MAASDRGRLTEGPIDNWLVILESPDRQTKWPNKLHTCRLVISFLLLFTV